jgi:hypothetical protein
VTARGPLETAAHEYADRGWPVFCCRPGGKAPDTPHGFKDATLGHGQIQRWWRDRPDRNVAVATGTSHDAASVDVLDVDVHPDGSGYPAFNALQAAGLVTGYLRVVGTPSGGLHVYFPGSGQPSGSVPAVHVDFKAAGGYVLAPPSVVDGRPYVVECDPVDGARVVFDWPAARTLITPATPRSGWGAGSTARAGRSSGLLGLDQLVRLVQRQGPGNRNRALFWAACRAVEDGLDLGPLADAAVTTGLTRVEVDRTLASAYRTTTTSSSSTVGGEGS